jgi:hypothetical protein
MLIFNNLFPRCNLGSFKSFMLYSLVHVFRKLFDENKHEVELMQ